MSGLGLAESKGMIERLESDLRVQHPERFTVPQAEKGCTVTATSLFLLLLVAVALVVFFRRTT